MKAAEKVTLRALSLPRLTDSQRQVQVLSSLSGYTQLRGTGSSCMRSFAVLLNCGPGQTARRYIRRGL